MNKTATAIVTGAGAGLGVEIARTLAGRGYNVVCADIATPEHGAEAVRAVGSGAQALALPTDVSSPEATREMVARTLERFGRVDVLVNNAAIASAGKIQPFEEITPDEFRRVFEVNVLGVFLCAQAVSAPMRRQGAGRIVNMVSGTAFKGSPFIAAYVASKGAVMTLTRTLANELGRDNILVNAVAPGYTPTKSMMQNKEMDEHFRRRAIETRAVPRNSTPQDIARAVAFLAGEDAGFVTGQILAVDGGSVFH